MEKRSNHVVPRSYGWIVRKYGSYKASRRFDTKKAAIDYGRALSISEKTDLYIHKRNGMVQDMKAYSKSASRMQRQ